MTNITGKLVNLEGLMEKHKTKLKKQKEEVKREDYH